ncbi:MAG: UDP-N-acetylmuramoyl-L-alanyl-D-glutamate--2,6-diaminopimelate ligase [Acidimicrobiia bacterium]|jgi:UDP-N-acetylmuramoyl-L-alanyl-D-glutamate--2,6-diaminopimelate ligase
MPPSRSLDELAAVTGGRVVGNGTTRVRDVTHDSRQAGPGTLFVAITGFQVDGHAFAGGAVERGSPAVAVEHELDLAVPQLVVASTRSSLAGLAAEVHGQPSRRLALVGVTGTNGKTTVTHMIEAMAIGAGKKAGLIGTVRTRVGGENVPTVRTTPEASDLQRILAHMADRGAEVVAVEVSSHALELGRVDSIWFEVAAFTNLGHDHLDFHHTEDAYFAAKARLFDPVRSRTAVIWVDDAAGRRLAEEVRVPVLTVGTSPGVDIRGRIVRAGLSSLEVDVDGVPGLGHLTVPVGGAFNAANALVALGCAVALGFDPSAAAAGLADLSPIPGRFELVSGDDPVGVIIDYAHTPDGISAALEAVRGAATGRVAVVVGAGGDRDHEKRPLMGAAAARADAVFVTSDNPRSEDPDAIIDEVMEGIPADSTVWRQGDRRSAIRAALTWAEAGDVVLVLGKGHERGQEVAGTVVPFDDRQVAREELRTLRGGTVR